MTSLPAGWTGVTLGEVCDIVMGQAPKGSTYNDRSDGWPLIAGAGDFGEGVPRSKKYTSAPTRLSAPGDIVLGIRASIGAKVLADGEYCLGRGVAALRGKQGLEDRYLWHWLTASSSALAAKGRGATFLQVNKADIAEMAMPLPPLEDQRRIAAILDKADELRAKRRAALNQLDTLTQAIFNDMFGRAVDSRSGRPLSDLVEIQIGPFGSLLHQSDYVTGGVPLVNPMHLVDGRIAPGLRETVTPESAARLTRYVLKEGDVVLGRRGDMGRCAVVGAAEEGFLCGSGSMILRPRHGGVHARFLGAALSSREARDELARRAKGVTMLNLNSDAVGSMRIVCPPLGQQVRYERAARAVELQADTQSRSAEEFGSLVASLQSRAFRGEL